MIGVRSMVMIVAMVMSLESDVTIAPSVMMEATSARIVTTSETVVATPVMIVMASVSLAS